MLKDKNLSEVLFQALEIKLGMLFNVASQGLNNISLYRETLVLTIHQNWEKKQL